MSSTNVLASTEKTSPNTNTIDQTISPVTHANAQTVPLRVDPVSTVFPDQTFAIATKVKKEKSKKKKPASKKKSSSTAVKNTPKLKRGESKVPLTMEDLYLKENPFNIPNVDGNVASSAKALQDTNVKASSEGKSAISSGIDSSTAEKESLLEKGNTDETLKTVDVNSDDKPRVVDKNDVSYDACDTAGTDTTHMVGNTIVDETVKIPGEKQDVEPDVETSVGQQVTEQIDEPSLTQDEVILEKHTENVAPNVGNQVETTSVDLEMQEPSEIPQSKIHGPSIAKWLRSSTGKTSHTPTKTPMTRMKSAAIGPKKGWSKVAPKVTSEKKSKKRKLVELSDSEYENVEADVPHIPVTAQRKSAGKKTAASVSDVPTDNISFHYPEYAQR
jgi:hypothetical protein